MKIVYTYHCCQQAVGGISRYFFEIYRRLSLDIKVEVQSHYMNNLYFSQIIHGKKKDICKRPFITKYHVRNLIENWFMLKFLRKSDADIIHLTGESPWVFNCINSKKKVVVTIHDMIPELNHNYRRILPRKQCIKKADAIICVSNRTKTDLLNIYPDIDKNKIFVIYHGYENRPTNEAKGKEEFLNLNLSKYLLYVGVREGYKNFNTMLKAIAPILKEKEIELVCTGHPFGANEQELINELNVGNWVRNVGFVSEQLLVQLYKGASTFIFPSKYEGFGIPILEALSNNCPLCLSDTSCFPEIAADAGAYFNPDSVESIEKCVRNILDNESYRTNLIEKGKERVKLFSWDTAANKTLDVYKWLLNKGE